jgi:hypothetical protein
MQSYLSHLLGDIADACRQEQPPPSSSASMEEYLDEAERWLESDPQFTFAYYCGLTKEQFPPARLLSEIQMEEICTAFNKLLFTWNIGVDIPDHLPVSKRYTLLVTVLDEKVDIQDAGFIDIEFCNDDPPTCPLNEYCTCKEFLKEDDMGENMNDSL